MERGFSAGLQARLQLLNRILLDHKLQQQEAVLAEQGTIGLLERSLEALLTANKFMKKVRHLQIAASDYSAIRKPSRVSSPATQPLQHAHCPQVFDRTRTSEPVTKPTEKRLQGRPQGAKPALEGAGAGEPPDPTEPTAQAGSPSKDRPDRVNANKSLSFRAFKAEARKGQTLQKSKEQGLYNHLDISVQIHDDKSAHRLEDELPSKPQPVKIDHLKSKRASLLLEDQALQQLLYSRSRHHFFHSADDHSGARVELPFEVRRTAQLPAEDLLFGRNGGTSALGDAHDLLLDNPESLDLYEIPPDSSQVVKRTIRGIKSPLENSSRPNSRQLDLFTNRGPPSEKAPGRKRKKPSDKQTSKEKRLQTAPGQPRSEQPATLAHSRHSPETSDSVRQEAPVETTKKETCRKAAEGLRVSSNNAKEAESGKRAASMEKSSLLTFIHRYADSQTKERQTRSGFKSPPTRLAATVLDMELKGGSMSMKKYPSGATSIVFPEQQNSIPFTVKASKNPDIPTRITFE